MTRMASVSVLFMSYKLWAVSPRSLLGEGEGGGLRLCVRSHFSKFLSAPARVSHIFCPLKVPLLSFYPFKVTIISFVHSRAINTRFRMHSLAF